jgi:DNA-binding transcriptional MerR regulator
VGDRSVAAERQLLKISELAERSEVSAGTIRHYLREGLLGEGDGIVRTSRNMAYYPHQLVERVRLIKRLQEERFMPLRMIKVVLEEDPERALAPRKADAPPRRRSASAMRFPATCSIASRRSAC